MDSIPKIEDAIAGLQGEMISKLIITVAIVIILSILRTLVLRLIQKYAKNPRIRFSTKKITLNVTFIFGFFWILSVWINEFQSLFTFLGLISAGVAVALKDPIVNIFGWVFLIWRHPFKVGDRIQIGEQAGDIIDIRLFQFSMMEIGNWVNADQYTGRIINVPNSHIFSMQHSLYSTDLEMLWDELDITVSFESNHKKAKALLEDIVYDYNKIFTNKMNTDLANEDGKFALDSIRFNPGVYTELKPNGVNFVVRYFFPYKERRKAKHEIVEQIIEAFGKTKDIEFAYPTTRFYQRQEQSEKTKFNTD